MIRIFALMLFLTLIGATAGAASLPGPEGLWLTGEQRAVIDIKHCGSTLCGNIVWIVPGGMQTDAKNPDESLQSRPMCGLEVLSGFRQQDATHWNDGMIYKADDGDTYHATLQMLPTGKLLVRGYIGMPLFGKSQTWTRVEAKDYPRCKVRSHSGRLAD
jgi:uncharacterized protein (DUF2147 family)